MTKAQTNKSPDTTSHEEEPSLARLSEVLRQQMMDSPYQTLAGALGVGFFVGGNLWKPVARALLGWGARLAVGAALSQVPRSEP